MIEALKSTLFSLPEMLRIPDLAAAIGALPWPGSVQRSARCGIAALSRRIEAVAAYFSAEAAASATDERDDAEAPLDAELPFEDEVPIEAVAPAPTGGPDPEAAGLVAAITAVDLDTSLSAIEALAARGGPVAVEAFSRLLADRSGFYLPAARLAAARGLVRCGGLAADAQLKLAGAEADPAVAEALRG